MDPIIVQGTNSEPPEDYLRRTVFPDLMKSLEQTFEQLEHYDTQRPVNRRLVCGLDLLAENLWNSSKNSPEPKHLFLREKVQELLKKNPRPRFSRFMTLCHETAATRIQANFRGYLVRKQLDVTEMRQFWKQIRGTKIKKTCKLEEGPRKCKK